MLQLVKPQLQIARRLSVGQMLPINQLAKQLYTKNIPRCYLQLADENHSSYANQQLASYMTFKVRDGHQGSIGLPCHVYVHAFSQTNGSYNLTICAMSRAACIIGSELRSGHMTIPKSSNTRSAHNYTKINTQLASQLPSYIKINLESNKWLAIYQLEI